MSLFDSFASALKIRGKDNKIKDAKNTIHEMTKRINQLEIENGKLKEQIDKEQDDTSLWNLRWQNSGAFYLFLNRFNYELCEYFKMSFWLV